MHTKSKAVKNKAANSLGLANATCVPPSMKKAAFRLASKYFVALL